MWDTGYLTLYNNTISHIVTLCSYWVMLAMEKHMKYAQRIKDLCEWSPLINAITWQSASWATKEGNNAREKSMLHGPYETDRYIAEEKKRKHFKDICLWRKQSVSLKHAELRGNMRYDFKKEISIHYNLTGTSTVLPRYYDTYDAWSWMHTHTHTESRLRYA